MTDPIADLLTRLRNAYLAKQGSVAVPYSRLKGEILEILKGEGLIASLERVPLRPSATAAAMVYQQPVVAAVSRPRHAFPASPDVDYLTVTLKYEPDGQPTIRHLKRVSRPGRRVYVDHRHLPIVLNNYGLAVVSTSRGLMTNREARKKHLGGEVLFEVY